MARISTSAAKAKGRNLQKAVRDAVLALFPHLTPDDVRSCPMGSNGTDLMLSPAAQASFPYAVECKARAKVGLVYEALDQAKASDKNGLTPVAVIKADRKRPLVVIDLDDFMMLLG